VVNNSSFPRRAAVAALLAAGATGVVLTQRRWRGAHDPCQPDRYRLAEGEAFKVETDDGAVLHGTVIGDGPTVVLAHCWTGDRSVWAPVAARLVEEGRQVVLYDHRGHGASSLGPAEPTVARLGADLRLVLETLDVQDAVLAGHSMGGMTAMALSIDHPEVAAERLRSQVLVATGAGQVTGGVLGALSLRLIGDPWAERLMAGPAGPALVRVAVGREPRLAHLVSTRDAFVAMPAADRLAFLRAISAMDLTSGLAGVAVPTTVVVGRRDLLTPPELGRAIARSVPGARLVEVPDGGHMLPLEAPDLLADLIARPWLGKGPQLMEEPGCRGPGGKDKGVAA
jgi:pimeloyl-ACP methyl ester carboxylesterase